MNSLSFKPHNHSDCQQSAMEHAKQLCAEKGKQLTPLRQTVLNFVWQSHEPIKAYDILNQLLAVHPGSAPPTVYRALDFLQEMGLVHKIESLNAYLGCSVPDHQHRSVFFICQGCGLVGELEDEKLNGYIEQLSGKANFELKQMNLELHGICANCEDRP